MSFIGGKMGMSVARDLIDGMATGLLPKVPSFLAHSKSRDSLYGPGIA